MKIYGLLGKKVDYSLSPFMHNAAFKATGMDAEYKIFNNNENDLENFFSKIRSGEIAGCNVTIPYKEKSIQFMDKLSPVTKEITALNTVSFKGGVMQGNNTDYEGFTKALTGSGEGDLGFNPDKKSVFIFGAGGAAKAIVYALISMGISKIAIADLDPKRAEALAEYITRKKCVNLLATVVNDSSDYENFISKADLLVNATPCGMKDGDPELFDYRYIHDKLYVFDLIYAVSTPLLREAASRSCKAVNGLNMLLYQAGKSFSIWTDVPAPIEVMKKALLERMAK